MYEARFCIKRKERLLSCLRLSQPHLIFRYTIMLLVLKSGKTSCKVEKCLGICMGIPVSKLFENEIAADIYMLKVNNRNNRTLCEICSKLLVKTTIVAKLSIDVFPETFLLALSRTHTFFLGIHCCL